MLYNKDWDRTNPVADLLLKAADLIEAKGHTKFARVGPNGSMCFLGALAVAQGYAGGIGSLSDPDPDFSIAATKAVARHLGMVVKHTHTKDERWPVVDWNNHPERTGQEVIDAMRATAHSLTKEKVNA